MFMNLKIPVQNLSSYTVTNNSIITIEVVPNNANEITEVKALLLHVNYQNSTIAPMANGFAVDSSTPYPSQGSNWSADGYQLYKISDFDGNERWTVFINPGNNDHEPGNLVLLKVTSTSGTE